MNTPKLVNYQVYNPDIKEREILDCTTRGNVIRFYLGKNGEQWGDDWSDPFDNAGTVYMRYVGATVDMYVPYNDVILTAMDVSYQYYSGFSKEQMRDGCFPCAIIVPEKIQQNFCDLTFEKCQGGADVHKYYCGRTLFLKDVPDSAEPEISRATVVNKDIKQREIIDCTIRGNVIHCYLGKNGTQTGEGWSERNYEEYAETVDEKYVGAVKDIYVPYDDIILTPADYGDWRCRCEYSKDDMKDRKVPCFIIVPAKTYVDEYESNSFDRYLENPDVRKYYFGDVILNKLNRINNKLASV